MVAHERMRVERIFVAIRGNETLYILFLWVRELLVRAWQAAPQILCNIPEAWYDTEDRQDVANQSDTKEAPYNGT